MTRFFFRSAFLSLTLAGLVCSGCTRKGNEVPLIRPVQGAVLPGISALAFNSSGTELITLSETGERCYWDLARGSLIRSGSLDNAGTEDAPPPLTAAGSGPVYSPDGSKKIFPAPDGSVCLADAVTGTELARYYRFTGNGEWVSISGSAYYNASPGGASFLEASAGNKTYRLDKLSQLLYRPDLFYAQLTGDTAGAAGTSRSNAEPASIKDLFREDQTPPVVSLSLANETAPAELTLKITSRKGGAGTIAFYRRSGTFEIPSGYTDPEKAGAVKYTEKGAACYELHIGSGTQLSTLRPGMLGVGVFNKTNTVESETSWIEIPETAVPVSTGSSAPALRLLLAGSADVRDDAATLENFFSSQSGGGLFSAVETAELCGEKFSSPDFIKTLGDLCARTKENDVLVLFYRGQGSSDSLGNLILGPGNETSAEQVLQLLTGTASNSVLVLFDLSFREQREKEQREKMETALLRFRQRLGPRAVFASYNPNERGASFTDAVIQALSPDFSIAVNRYASAAELIDRMSAVFSGAEVGAAQVSPGSQGNPFGRDFLAFSPLENFMVADLLINTGELKFQTMASGKLKIDKVDKSPVPLVFGTTMSRILSPGNYIIDMIYRNGYRETRTVQLRKKESTWVIFTYTPPLLTGNYVAGDLSRILSSRGINTSELNPANYQKIDREAMEGMGMAPWYVAFLGGQKLYKEGNYDKAIAEFSRAISIKADYADAYVSRGNAQRKKGDAGKAIEDYNRALGLKSGYAEVYNYRGFIYAGRGDLKKAIDDYSQAIKYKADYADALFNRAYAYMKQGSWDQAIADYTQVLKLEPSNASAYNERGSAWFSKGDKTKAAADFAAADRLKAKQ